MVAGFFQMDEMQAEPCQYIGRRVYPPSLLPVLVLVLDGEEGHSVAQREAFKLS